MTQTQITGSNVELPDRSILDLATLTPRNYTQYTSDFTQEEQQDAATVADFVKNYEQTVELNATQIEAITDTVMGSAEAYFNLIEQGGNAVAESADAGVRAISDFMQRSPSFRTAMNDFKSNGFVRTTEATLAVGGAVEDAVGGSMSTLDFVTNFFGAAATLGSSVFDRLGSGYSDAQSQAFGAAYVLAEREATRRGGTGEEVSQRATNVLDRVLSYVQAAAVQFPIVQQVVNFVGNGEWSGEGWTQAGVTAAEEAAERAAAAGGTSFSQNQAYFLEKNTTTRTTTATQTTATAILASAGEIAGVDALEVSSLLQRGGTYLNQQGREVSVEALTNGNGIQTTETGRSRDDLLQSSWEAVNPTRLAVNADGTTNWSNILGTGAVGLAAYAGRNQIASAASGLATRSASVAGFPGREAGRVVDAVDDIRTTPAASTSSRVFARTDNMGPRLQGGFRTADAGAQTARSLTSAAAPILRRAGYVGVAIGAAGDGTEMVQAGLNGDMSGVAVNGAEVVGGAAGGVGGSLAGGTAGAWSGGWIGRGIGTGVGFVVGGVAGFFGGAGVGAIPGAMAGAAIGGTAGHAIGAVAGGVGGSVAGGSAGYSGGRYVTGSGARLIAGTPEAEQRAQEMARAQALAGGAPASISGGAETTGPDGMPSVPTLATGFAVAV